MNDQVASRLAGFHAQGMQLVTGIGDDGSAVGANGSSLVAPGGSTVYTFFAEKEGAFLVTSLGASFGGQGSAGNNSAGMFAVINVEPPGASFYRSQVSEEEMRLATTGRSADGTPVLDYEATYPSAPGTGVPGATIAASTPAGSTFVPVGGDPTRLTAPFPPSGRVRLVPPAGSVLAEEILAYTIDTAAPNGFTISGTGTPAATTDVEVNASSTSIVVVQDPNQRPAPFPAEGHVTLSATTPGGAATETLHFTRSATDPATLLLDAGVVPASTWPVGSTLQLTDATGVAASVPLALAQAWPAGATAQAVDEAGALLSVPVPNVWAREGKAGLPILNMLGGIELVHSDLNAVIAGHDPAGTSPQHLPAGERRQAQPQRCPTGWSRSASSPSSSTTRCRSANAFPLWYVPDEQAGQSRWLTPCTPWGTCS